MEATGCARRRLDLMPITYYAAGNAPTISHDAPLQGLDVMDGLSMLDAMDAVVQHLAANGLAVDPVVDARSEVQAARTWTIHPGPGEIRLFDDYNAGIRHLEVEAESELHDTLCDAVERLLPLDDYDALLSDWERGVGEARSLVKLAIAGADPLEDPVFEAIAAALSHESGHVRCMAAYAVAMHGDARFLALLEQRATTEDDPNALDIVERALAMYVGGDG